MSRLIVMIVGMVLMSDQVFADEFYLGANIGSSAYDDTASTQPLPVWDFDNLPPSGSITDRPFDSDDFSWSAYAGWSVTDWFAIEAGYIDLGEGVSELFYVPVASSPGTILTVGGGATDTRITTDVSELYVGPKLTWAFSENFSANVLAAITSASFESDGNLIVARNTIQPFVYAPVPVQSPESETGALLGLGLQWKIDQKVSLELSYRKHDSKVLDIETLTLGFQVAL